MSFESAPYIKDPDAVSSYAIDASIWLGSDIISESTWTVDTGITVDSSGNTTTVATVVLSGGAAGTTYKVTNKIVTAAGLTEYTTIEIYVQETALGITRSTFSIATEVQKNPNIGTLYPTYIMRLVNEAMSSIVRECRLPRWPAQEKGYSQGGKTPSTNISAIDTNQFRIRVNGSSVLDITVTLANCTTGTLTATELQTQIRAASISAYGHDEVTVTYTGGVYVITSGRYGEASRIEIGFTEADKHVCQQLKLSPTFGGLEFPGADFIEELHWTAVILTEILYNKLGVEGAQAVSVPKGLSYTEWKADPRLEGILSTYRRIW